MMPQLGFHYNAFCQEEAFQKKTFSEMLLSAFEEHVSKCS
jgi:hypothetical protein